MGDKKPAPGLGDIVWIRDGVSLTRCADCIVQGNTIDAAVPLTRTTPAGGGARLPVESVVCFSAGFRTTKGKLLIPGDDIVVGGVNFGQCFRIGCPGGTGSLAPWMMTKGVPRTTRQRPL
jgi:hypothetical protein